MTYWNFLAVFLATPIIFLGVLAVIDHNRGRKIVDGFSAKPFWLAVLLNMVIAPLYTFVWDNYLVANHVWWYDAKLVSGIVLGWVPIEEYVFFVLQPLLVGLWILFLLHRLRVDQNVLENPSTWRKRPLIALISLWIVSIMLLGSTWENGLYLALQLLWALPPMILQIFFGGDILRKNSKLLLMSIFIMTIYLSVADFVAVRAGTWSINPQKTVNFLIGGVLPVEEFLFFLLTNMLITFGIILFISKDSLERFNIFQRGLEETIHVIRSSNT